MPPVRAPPGTGGRPAAPLHRRLPVSPLSSRRPDRSATRLDVALPLTLAQVQEQTPTGQPVPRATPRPGPAATPNTNGRNPSSAPPPPTRSRSRAPPRCLRAITVAAPARQALGPLGLHLAQTVDLLLASSQADSRRSTGHAAYGRRVRKENHRAGGAFVHLPHKLSAWPCGFRVRPAGEAST